VWPTAKAVGLRDRPNDESPARQVAAHLAGEYTEVMFGVRVRRNPDHWKNACRRHPRILNTLLAMLVILTATLVPRPGRAQMLRPGKFSGVVIFDRWDSCILYSGVFLMYVSENVKEGLRQYQGQAIQLDVSKFVQRMNPGDALITEYRMLGPAPDTASHSPVPTVPEGLVLTADGPLKNQGLPAVTVSIRNVGNESVRIVTSEIGIALLTRKEKELDYLETPSDGPSTAVITRVGVVSRGGKLEISSGEIKRSYSYSSEPDSPLPREFDLAPGQSRSTRLTFNVPSGEYQFIFGYGGGGFQAKCLTSNKVSFDIPK